jgi:hypothetical protein
MLVFKDENGGYKSMTLPLVTVAAEWLTVDVIKNLPEDERKKLISEGVLDN